MQRINVDLNNPSYKQQLGATWRSATGFIPGEPNQGFTAEIEGSPCRLPAYDDSNWAVCDNLGDVLSKGVCAAWWRTTITLPKQIDGIDVAGARLYLETTVDDYAEIWVNGECNLLTGVPHGHNRPNRLELSQNAQAGDVFHIAILGINGPFAKPLGGVFIRYVILGVEIFGR